MSVLSFIYTISLGRSLADFISSILPSVCPLSDRVSKSSFLNMCRRHFICLFLKLIISFTVVCISLSAMLHELNVIFYVGFYYVFVKINIVRHRATESDR